MCCKEAGSVLLAVCMQVCLFFCVFFRGGEGGGQCPLSVVVEGPEVKGYGDWGGVEYKNGCQKEVHYFP